MKFTFIVLGAALGWTLLAVGAFMLHDHRSGLANLASLMTLWTLWPVWLVAWPAVALYWAVRIARYAYGEADSTPPRTFGPSDYPPPKAAGLPGWLMALLFAFIVGAVLYLGAGYFRNAEPAAPATHPQPRKVHRVTKPPT